MRRRRRYRRRAGRWRALRGVGGVSDQHAEQAVHEEREDEGQAHPDEADCWQQREAHHRGRDKANEDLELTEAELDSVVTINIDEPVRAALGDPSQG